MASSIVLALIITAVTELFITKHVEKTVHDDHIDHDAAEFTKPGASEEAAEENAKKEERNTASSSSSNGRDKLILNDAERRGLRYGNIAAVIFLALWFAALFIPGSPLRGEGDGILNSVLLTDVVASICLLYTSDAADE